MHRSTGHRRSRLTALCGTVVIALGASLLAACSSSGTGAQAQEQTAIVPTLQGSTADDIFPIVSGPQITPYNQQDFQWLMYRQLYWYGGQPGNEFGLYQQISLAYPPVYSNHDTVVTIRLKKYYWSDGTPVTARDVTFFLNLVTANKNYWGMYTPGEFPDNVKSAQIVNPETVRITLTGAFSPLWYSANELSSIIPLPQQAWDKTSATGKAGNYDETHAGAVAVFKYLLSQAQSVNTYASNPIWQVVDGPFRLKSYSTRGDIVLVPNTHYSGSPKPQLKELIERPFTSPTAEFDALLAQTGLTTGAVPSQDDNEIRTLEADGYRLYNTYTYGFNYIVINFNSPAAGYLFRQLYIRQALQHVVNQPQDVEYAYHGNATASYGPVPLAPPSPYTTAFERSNPYPFSISAAESLLRSHGWAVHPGGTDTCALPGTGPSECGAGIPKGKALSFKVVYASGDPGYTIMMDNFQSAARSAGITVQLSEGQFNQITGITGVCAMGTSACNWDGVMYGGSTMGVYPTGNGFFNTNANGQGNYNSAEADQLINATDYQAGISHFYAYENYIAQQLPYIFLPWEQMEVNNVVAKNLRGFTADQDNPFSDTFPEDWYFAK
jgi:peptide/nickel transport system substrate-binding protein